MGRPTPAHRQHTTGRAYSGHRRPISCPVSRISSPQTPFNPHISTALTAYCKSPYPHCSAPAASDQEKVCSRSTVDTALEISQQLKAPVLNKPDYSARRASTGIQPISHDARIGRSSPSTPARGNAATQPRVTASHGCTPNNSLRINNDAYGVIEDSL